MRADGLRYALRLTRYAKPWLFETARAPNKMPTGLERKRVAPQARREAPRRHRPCCRGTEAARTLLPRKSRRARARRGTEAARTLLPRKSRRARARRGSLGGAPAPRGARRTRRRVRKRRATPPPGPRSALRPRRYFVRSSKIVDALARYRVSALSAKLIFRTGRSSHRL